MSAPEASMPEDVSVNLDSLINRLTERLSKSQISDDVESKKVD